MPLDTIRVRGYRELVRAADRAGLESRRYVRAAFREAGDVVRVDATARFARYDARSAAGFRTRVRVRGVAVDQSIRKTTGKRPDYGKLQMRVLLRSLAAKAKVIDQNFEQALDKVCDHFDRI